ncbi:hypothetical protein [Geothermobacter hydrogeniphilus]|uniref:Lipoprotein n=1 Tax=Geothermobacter hydrogeniphilus TaxID=1969733 RepID=A0A1X0Y030_9BACT|nr:hypothetical protein [Geothermobacter hydrogeniphilus]ORJ58540.1 hypothetical protein B5V00_11865 [Geothermobacter hydrogeniphilus]
MKRICISLIAVLVLLVGCAPKQQGLAKKYDKDEYRAMTLCVGATDVALFAATQKLNGIPINSVKQNYLNSKLALASIDKVYKSDFSSPWEFAITFFELCAEEVGNVPLERIDYADFCLQNQMIAGVAHQFKTNGDNKETAYRFFSNYKSKTVKEVIDIVYNENKTSSQAKLDAWGSCIGYAVYQ